MLQVVRLSMLSCNVLRQNGVAGVSNYRGKYQLESEPELDMYFLGEGAMKYILSPHLRPH